MPLHESCYTLHISTPPFKLADTESSKASLCSSIARVDVEIFQNCGTPKLYGELYRLDESSWPLETITTELFYYKNGIWRTSNDSQHVALKNVGFIAELDAHFDDTKYFLDFIEVTTHQIAEMWQKAAQEHKVKDCEEK